MKMLKFIFCFACLLALAGCQVPRTTVTINPSTGMVTVDSPKEIDMTNFIATLPSGGQVTIGAYHSHNAPDVIAAQAAGNAQMADRLITLTEKLGKLSAEKAATGGLAP